MYDVKAFLIYNSLPHIMYVHRRKNIIYLQEFLKQENKRVFGQAFLLCFEASANKIYFYQQCMYIVFILQCQKLQNKISNFTK